MKIKELSDLSNIEVTSIQELIKSNNNVYLIGIDVGEKKKEEATELLRSVSRVFNEAGIEVIVYPIGKEFPKIKINKLEKE